MDTLRNELIGNAAASQRSGFLRLPAVHSPQGPHAKPKCHSPGRPNGFTLVEVMVVIAIIMILAGVLFTSAGAYLNYRKSAKTDLMLNAAAGVANRLKQSLGHPLDHMESQYYRVVAPGLDRPMTPTEYFVFKCSYSEESISALRAVPELLVNATALPGQPTGDSYLRSGSRLMVKVVNVHQDLNNPAAPWVNETVVDYVAGDATKPGYALLTLVDGWGKEVEYRASRSDTALDTNNDGIGDAPNEPFLPGTWPSHPEWTGWPGYGTTPDPDTGLLNPQNPAMPNYEYPYLISAGKKGKWGVLGGHQLNAADSDASDNRNSIQSAIN